MNPIDTSADLSPYQQELVLRIQRHTPSEGLHETAVPGLRFMRASQVSEPMPAVYAPSLCMVAQGSKTAALGEELYRYDPAAYLVTSVHLPIIGKVAEASAQLPYLSLQLDFRADVIVDIVKDAGVPGTSRTDSLRGIALNRPTASLLDAVLRLVRLLHAPADIPTLAPLFVREVLYRVLQGEQGALIRQFAVIGSHAHSISKAIQLLHRDYSKALHMEELAKEVSLSPSALFKHFKKVTALSPLQYQKAIRLQEARRLLLTERLDAAEAGFRVGYESPSQFSREYARLFGRPPISDVLHVRESALPQESSSL
ncbi:MULTISPECIES: AraC family transcriptional regulator [Paenibacillus]|uniref:AraC family transcriptional regulator n=1 Tax=Paenibacillus TaxID=44249 RepID=UPI0022B932CD|nr:AraC family transcriptional regulator [Paenibacillus caseinilyticus]MCZ8520331.1 AraC family transcriptional regulator [Paenibacillus caseinilyticus]